MLTKSAILQTRAISNCRGRYDMGNPWHFQFHCMHKLILHCEEHNPVLLGRAFR